MPLGGASHLGSCNRRKIPSIKEWAKKKRSLLDVAQHAGDKMCLARVLVAGRFLVTKVKNADEPLTPADVKVWSQLKCGKPRGLQKDCAQLLCEQAGIDPLKEAGLDEVALFQQALPNLQIVVYGTDSDGPLYYDPQKKNQNPVYIFITMATIS